MSLKTAWADESKSAQTTDHRHVHLATKVVTRLVNARRFARACLLPIANVLYPQGNLRTEYV